MGLCGIQTFMEKKAVTFRIDPTIVKKLKYLALDHDKTLTELYLEAIQDLFKKYGRGTEK
jgi:predicted transcriptional regulator